MSIYALSNDGHVHLVNPIGAEHTLCGSAFDIDSEPDGAHLAWKKCSKRTVTCPWCILVIKDCRGVRCAKGDGV